VSAPVRIATRASELALRQARQLQRLLEGAGVASELITYKTVGDRKLDQPLSEIGAKGLFTEELERDLARGAVDCCVHSLKDLPTTLPAGLEIGAVLEREDPRDALVVNAVTGASTIGDLPRGSRVGTSSLRRRAQLAALRPDVEIVDLRGNVPTRVRKVDEGQVHAAILAAAGLHRLDIHQRIAAYLDPPAWLPAAGQGAIAIECRIDDGRMRELITPFHHRETAIAVEAERSFLRALEGGCQVPIGAVLITDDAGRRVLHGLIADLTGTRVIRDHVDVDAATPVQSGLRLATLLRERGADEILSGLHRAHRVPAPQPE
jgi:hydroxymethylbilane synthase